MCKNRIDRKEYSLLEIANYYANECRLHGTPFQRIDMSIPFEERKKKPARPWKTHQTEAPSQSMRELWFDGDRYGIGILCGAVSDNAVVFDIENMRTADEWERSVRGSKHAEWLDKAPKVLTPGGGVHWYFRTDFAPPGGYHLASRLNDGKTELLMELLAERDLVLAPGSPADCHPENKEYVLAQGDFAQIPVISKELFDKFVSAGKALDELPPRSKNQRPVPKKYWKVANAYADKTEWSELLAPAEFTLTDTKEDEQFWQKPNSSDDGHHVTTNYMGLDRLYCFSTACSPFEKGRSYTKFEVYALLEHDGNLSTAFDALKAEGFGKSQKNAQEELVEFAKKRCELWHDTYQKGYATIDVKGHRENHSLRSTIFRQFLENEFLDSTGQLPNSQAFESALNVLQAIARKGPELKPWLRIGQHADDVYVDLCDDLWQCVKISRDGWEVITSPPIKFLRTKGMRSLPIPVASDDLDDLFSLLNIKDKHERILTTAWMLGTISPTGPYPLLVLTGPHGSSKSTTAKTLKKLIDPAEPRARTLPASNRDLFIAANNSFVLNFDNVSSIRNWLSDDLCQLATEGGFATRKLHTDEDEMLFEKSCPIILNGIEEIVRRADLLDRCIKLELQAIDDDKRISERDFWKAFDKCHPKSLGFLFSVVSASLSLMDQIESVPLPRMADFAQRVIASEEALGWSQGSFLIAYSQNRQECMKIGLDAYPIVELIEKLLESGEFNGTPTELLRKLRCMNDDFIRLPRNAQALSGILKRLEPSLRAVGIEVLRVRSHERRITIRKREIDRQHRRRDETL